MKNLLLAFLLPLHANACLWVDGTTIDGNKGRIEGRAEGRYPADVLRKSMDLHPEDRFDVLMLNRARSTRDSFTTLETEGVEKVFDGKYEDAFRLQRNRIRTTGALQHCGQHGAQPMS